MIPELRRVRLPVRRILPFRAISIHRFVQPHSSLTIGRNRRQFAELNKQDILAEENQLTEIEARRLPFARIAGKPMEPWNTGKSVLIAAANGRICSRGMNFS